MNGTGGGHAQNEVEEEKKGEDKDKEGDILLQPVNFPLLLSDPLLGHCKLFMQ